MENMYFVHTQKIFEVSAAEFEKVSKFRPKKEGAMVFTMDEFDEMLGSEGRIEGNFVEQYVSCDDDVSVPCQIVSISPGELEQLMLARELAAASSNSLFGAFDHGR